MTPLRTLEADRGTTRKTLWQLFDGALVESVLMRYPDRVTMCVSSQAGCGMACPFCATGQGGLERNMSTAEIVEQVVAGARSLARGEVPGGPGRVSNVVFMGMGEPLANYKAVIGAVRRLTDPAPAGLGMSARGVTVSTVGLVPRINQLAEEGIPVTLALSLHAPDDELRNELVPINTRFSVAETVDAAWNYAKVTRRRVSIEYAMMRGINDQGWRADLLAEVLNGYGDWGWVHVNLIPLNPTPGSKWTASDPADEREFVRRLRVARHPHHGPRHPRPRDRRRLRAAGRDRVVSRPRRGRRGGEPGLGLGARDRSHGRDAGVPAGPDARVVRRPAGAAAARPGAAGRRRGRRGARARPGARAARGQLLGQARTTTHRSTSLFLARGGVLDETLDVLARRPHSGHARPRHVGRGARAALGHRRRRPPATTTAVGADVFGGCDAAGRRARPPPSNEPQVDCRRRRHRLRRRLPRRPPVGTGGLALVDGVARLWGGAVREEARGRGVYRALLDAASATGSTAAPRWPW